MTAMDQREVYPNAPVVLVALEVRHPAAQPMSPGALAQVKRSLSGDVPLQRDSTIMNVTFQAGPSTPPEVVSETAPRFFSRDSSTAVTFRKEAIVIETTRYSGYEELRRLIQLAVQARQTASPIDGVDRIGLRYIDEIRVPGMDPGAEALAWAPWVDESLLGPAPLGGNLGLMAGLLQGFAVFTAGPDRSLALRYGPAEGYAVDPGGDLNRTTTPPGPFFLLDIDSYWTRSGTTPEADPAWVLEVCDDLHGPVRTLFEQLITNRLRNEVLRDGGY